jgi:hypothetical protein
VLGFVAFALLASSAHTVQAAAVVATFHKRFNVWSGRAYVFVWMIFTAVTSVMLGIGWGVGMSIVALVLHVSIQLMAANVTPGELMRASNGLFGAVFGSAQAAASAQQAVQGDGPASGGPAP